MKLMPEEIVEKYNLKKFEHDGWVYIKIVKVSKRLSQGTPLLGSTIIYWGHFYIHTFGCVFHGIKMDSLRLR